MNVRAIVKSVLNILTEFPLFYAARSLPPVPYSAPVNQSTPKTLIEADVTRMSREWITSKLLLVAELSPALFITKQSLGPLRHFLVTLGESCEDAQKLLGGRTATYTGPNGGSNLIGIVQPVLYRWKNSNQPEGSNLDPYLEMTSYLQDSKLHDVISELGEGEPRNVLT